jgi:hypothetical protein
VLDASHGKGSRVSRDSSGRRQKKRKSLRGLLGLEEGGRLGSGKGWASFLLPHFFSSSDLFFFFLQNYFRKKQERALERVQNMFQQIKFENFIFI